MLASNQEKVKIKKEKNTPAYGAYKLRKIDSIEDNTITVRPKNEQNLLMDRLQLAQLLPRTPSQSSSDFPTIDNLRSENEWRSLNTFRLSRQVSQLSTRSLNEDDDVDSSRWDWLWELLRLPVLLLTLGLTTAILGIVADISISALQELHNSLVSQDLNDKWSWAMYVLVAVGLALMSCWITLAYCPLAMGGGIPEVKTLLSGMEQPNLLSIRLIMAKSLGMIFGIASGVSAGTEGPLIHIACAIAETLMSCLPFLRVKKNTFLRLAVLGHACAAGVAVSFGTPFAAVLFSIEVTASAYHVKMLPATLFTSVTVCLASFFLGQLQAFKLFHNTDVEFSQGYSSIDVAMIIILAVSCGLLAALFVKMSIFVTGVMGWLKGHSPSPLRLYIITIAMTLIFAPIVYLDIAGGVVGGQSTVTANLFNPNNVDFAAYLPSYLLLKILVTIVSINMPLPIGLFDAVFLIGGCFGRLFGTFVTGLNIVGISFESWEIAVAGAVFFSSGVTHTLAPAVIVYELAGARMTSLPLCLGTFIANGIASLLTQSIYDALIRSKDVPFLPDLQPEAATIPAFRLMLRTKFLPILSLNSTYQQVKELLEEFEDPTMCPEIPVVDSLDKMHLIGSVSWNHLRKTMDHFNRALKKGVMLKPATKVRRSNSCGLFDVTSQATDSDIELFSNSYITDEEIDELRNSYHSNVVVPSRRSFRADGGVMDWLKSEELLEDSDSSVPSFSRPMSPMSMEDDMDSSGALELPRPRPKIVYDKNGQGKQSSKSKSPILTVSSKSLPRNYNSPTPKKVHVPKTAAGLFVNEETKKINVPATTRLVFVILKENSKFVEVSAPDATDLYTIESITTPFNPSPYQTVHTTELGNLDYVFRMLKLNVAFITRCGRLDGALTREVLRQFTVAYTKDPLEQSLQYCAAIGKNFRFC